MKTVWFIAVLMTIGQQAIAEVTPLQPLPPELQRYLDICKQSGDLTQNTGQLVFWTSLQQYVSKFSHREQLSPENAELLSRTVYEIMKPIMGNNQTRYKRQADIRTRREIRALTSTERSDYFNAVNAAKNDTVRLQPNVYDVLARFHVGPNINRAHFGPAFPSWHRVYLFIYESVLRRWYNPTVTVPYWASPLDEAMFDSTQSVIWNNDFFGTPNGVVREGSFASWPQLTPGTVITRNVGAAGGLISLTQERNIISNRFNAEILTPTATGGNNLEIIHGAPHVWVGGTMSGLQTAAFDPIFFSHHAYIDYIWQRFRDQQTVNPETDYPYDPSDPRSDPLHAPDANAGFTAVGDTTVFGMQLSALTQRIGYLNRFSEIIRYEELPECPCNSPYLFCDRGVCVSRTITEMSGTVSVPDRGLNLLNGPQNNTYIGSTKSKPSPPPVHQNEGCPRSTYIHDVETNYIGHNSFSTVSQWAYIPIKVVSKRPSGMTRFETYNLYDDHRPWHTHNELTSMCLQKGYNGCKKDDDAVGKINIVSYGLNHDGYSEDYIIVDNRLGVSEGSGYLPIKKPTRSEETEVIVAAFDSCGRVCKPYCNLPYCEGLNKNFNGGLSISSRLPKQYYNTYEEATLGLWKSSRSYGPKYQEDIVPITFFCEYGDTWIWDKYVPPPWNPPAMNINPTASANQKPVQTYNAGQNYVESLSLYPQGTRRESMKLSPTPNQEQVQTNNAGKNYFNSLQWYHQGTRRESRKPVPTPNQEQVQTNNAGQKNVKVLLSYPQGNRRDQLLSKPQQPNQEQVQTNKAGNIYIKLVPTYIQGNHEDQPLSQPKNQEPYQAPTTDSLKAKSDDPTSGSQQLHNGHANCCQVAPDCLIHVPCGGCNNFECQICEGSNTIAVCLRGRYSVTSSSATYREHIFDSK